MGSPTLLEAAHDRLRQLARHVRADEDCEDEDDLDAEMEAEQLAYEAMFAGTACTSGCGYCGRCC